MTDDKKPDTESETAADATSDQAAQSPPVNEPIDVEFEPATEPDGAADVVAAKSSGPGWAHSWELPLLLWSITRSSRVPTMS